MHVLYFVHPTGCALAAVLHCRPISLQQMLSQGAHHVHHLLTVPQLHCDHPATAVWDDAVCYFKEQQLVRVGRPYGRVCRRRLRQHLLDRCAAAGVRFVEAEVETASSAADAQAAELCLADGRTVRCRLPVLASGVAAGKLLRYEDGVPPVAAQTAYGIEV